jgi:hypothetical protein
VVIDDCFALSLLGIVAAQLDLVSEQYTAVQALFAGLGCTQQTCPDFANASCPSELCNSNGGVVKISFDEGLSGSIDGPALGVLTDLTSFVLANADLAHTTIPTQIGRLSLLTFLTLISSALTGTLPPEVGNMRSLEFLSVAGNKLTGTLPSLDKLTKLTYLDVSNNIDLGGNMPAMPTSLVKLIAKNCSFTALPVNLGALTALKSLFVTKNNISGAPPGLPSTLEACELQEEADTNCFDCPANGTVGKCLCRPNACPPTATTSTAASVKATTDTTLAPATSSMPAATLSTDLASTTTLVRASSIEDDFDVELALFVCGVLLALFGGGVAVFCVFKHRRRRAQHAAATNTDTNNGNANATELKPPPNSEYGRLVVAPAPTYSDVADVQAPAKTYGDVADVRANDYDIVKVSPQAEYDAPDSTLKL